MPEVDVVSADGLIDGDVGPLAGVALGDIKKFQCTLGAKRKACDHDSAEGVALIDVAEVKASLL